MVLPTLIMLVNIDLIKSDVHTTGKLQSRFSLNSEANASEFKENLN